MKNVHLHPCYASRFYAAVDDLVLGIREANLEHDLGRLGEHEWGQTIVDAVTAELRAPSTGLSAVVKKLRR